MPGLAHEWDAFYTIVGSSAAALVGLQFVVMALVADMERPGTTGEVDAFGTPTIVHFSVVLLLSAVMVAPWEGIRAPAAVIMTIGVAGVVYGAIVIGRARRQGGYVPVLEDWIWHTLLPPVAYAGFIVSGAGLARHPRPMLFVVATMSLLLLYSGIHNAWDTVTYIAVEYRARRGKP